MILRADDASYQTGTAGLAQQILEAAGVGGGLVVHLGCGDGRLTAALAAGDRYLVHGLDADAANVEAARGHLRSLGLYGRVSVEQYSGGRFPMSTTWRTWSCGRVSARFPWPR